MSDSVVSGSVLHAGCGLSSIPEWLSDATETRLDIDPSVNPDVVAGITDMGEIGQFDAVYTSHTLEHVAQHEVGVALSEFHRVLKPGGRAFIIVPDLEGVAPTHEVLFVSPAGPITGLDLFYGMAKLVKENHWMGHKTGFTKATLEAALRDAGFSAGAVSRISNHNLLAVGVK